MSTLKTTNLSHPSAASPNVVLGSTGSVAVAGKLTGAGLDIITPTSIANSGGSATATGGEVSFSAVSSVSLNGVFSASYLNYIVIVEFLGSADLTATSMRFRTAGTDNSSALYQIQGWYAGSITAAAINSVNTTNFSAPFAGTGNRGLGNYQISSPFVAQPTSALAQIAQPISTQATNLNVAIRHSSTTSFDGISLISGAGTMTGTIRVYGYKNS